MNLNEFRKLFRNLMVEEKQKGGRKKTTGLTILQMIREMNCISEEKMQEYYKELMTP